VFPKHRAVVLAQGCFWHGHGCHLFKWPKTREEFWRTKIGRNVENDARTFEALRARGWRVATVWECALKGRTRLDQHDTLVNLAEWLRSGQETITIRGRE
jgi:DNA mismatch endonuclease (patch repair protein)